MLVNAMRPGYLEALAGFDIGWTFKDSGGSTVTWRRASMYSSTPDKLGRLSDSSSGLRVGGEVSGNSNQFCVLFGSGTTAPTVNDYNMETPLSSFSDYFTYNISVNSTSTYIEYVATLTAITGVTISEIGLATNITTTNYTYGALQFLVARDTFTPITFAAGDAKVIKYRFTNGSTSVTTE